MSLDQLVTQYSSVYHHYSAEVRSFNNANMHRGNPIETQRKREWAVYHCDLSARAAHHYNDLLTKRKNSKTIGTRVGELTQRKDLKQKNDQSGRFVQPSSPLPKKKNSDSPKTKSGGTPMSPKESPPQPPPESFRRYAHKNLLLCTTDTQRKGMQELLTMTMESSIGKKDFYSTNWDFESLLPVPGGGENLNKADVSDNTRNKVSSESPSLQRKHSCNQQNSEGENASNEQRTDSNHIPTLSKVVKKINSINEQKKTMNDWYGGGGGEGESVKGASSQSPACITFQPKVFKKKRKNGWSMNANRRQMAKPSTKINNSYELETNLVGRERENDNFSNSRDHNFHAVPQETVSDSVGQFESHAQSNLEQQQTVSEWYDTPTSQTSIPPPPPPSTESIKREINMQDQQQTLTDWYGGENATDSKKNGEAVIMFKPKPMKKKKKNRKYMKRSLSAAKQKILSAQEKKNDAPDESHNGILMLPRVQTGSTHSNGYHNFNGKTNKEGFSNPVVKKDLHRNTNSKLQSPPTYERGDGFIPIEQIPHENKMKETKPTAGSAMMEEYYSTSLSHRQDKPIKQENHQQKNITAERSNGFTKESQKKKMRLSRDLDKSKNKLADRATRFAGPGGISSATSSRLEYNQNTDRYMGKSVIGGTLDKTLTEEDYEKMTVKGYCQVLEKSYLRLTSPPRAELVRPQEVLSRHLQNLKRKWRVYREKLYSPANMQGSSGDELSYTWFCSQFKAIRQDLTVQRIFNALSVDVYETHAKIALQENDLNEYNQSQTQLKELYFMLTHQASVKENCLTVPGLENHNEFIAYRIIYYVFLTGNQKYDGGSSDLLKIMISLTSVQRNDPAIIHALKVRVAVAEHDYHAFFRLQDVCPNLGAYLMDTLVPQIRAHGLRLMIQTYRPSIAVKFVLKEVGFSVEEGDSDGGKSWLQSCGCKFSTDGTMIITKKSILNENNLAGVKSSSLI